MQRVRAIVIYRFNVSAWLPLPRVAFSKCGIRGFSMKQARC